MTTPTDFDFLTGIVRVGSDAPAAWQQDGLLDFFADPNHAAWGSPLCRKLYHETLHFWQLLGWGYVANCAAADWQRVTAFEKTGVPTSTTRGLDSMSEAGRQPFSPRELLEAVARFWDVHTRSPAQVIADERISTEGLPGPLTMADPHGGPLVAYTNYAFDFVMQNGADCKEYAAPYRWLLDRVEGRSAFAVIMFPLCVHAAMSTPEPVAVFCEAIDLAYRDPMIRGLMNHRSGSIHSDWMMFWPPLARNIFGRAAMAKGGVMAPTPGFDVIRGGVLQAHPIYRDYPEKAMFRGYFRLHKPVATSDRPEAIQHAQDLQQAAIETPYLLFALPGEPVYRRALAETVAPPVVRFSNFEIAARRPAVGKFLAAQDGTPWEDTFAQASADVERRVTRFRNAEYAVSKGLPPNAFEARP